MKRIIYLYLEQSIVVGIKSPEPGCLGSHLSSTAYQLSDFSQIA